MFSASAVKNIFAHCGLELIDVIPQTTHGGSMRYVFAKTGARKVSNSVTKQLQHEVAKGLLHENTYHEFRRRCEQIKHDLLTLLTEKKQQDAKIVGYAATSKSTTVLNYCGIGPDLVDYICDTTPIKQGKFTPGSHIPVKAYSEFQNDYPDYALLLAWNHEAEIRNKETNYTKSGGKWILFFPEVKIST